jgi:hypothetical protein
MSAKLCSNVCGYKVRSFEPQLAQGRENSRAYSQNTLNNISKVFFIDR